MKVDMKVILALFLCGVTYSTASPTCSENELDKCGIPLGRYNEDFKITEEYLNIVCKSMSCMKDYKSRCGVESVEDSYKPMLVHSEKIYRAVCDTDSQALRKKYLDNIKCLYTHTMTSGNECRNGQIIEVGDPEYCPRIKEFLDCSIDLVDRECGKDAREVYIAVAPDMEFHGCKE